LEQQKKRDWREQHVRSSILAKKTLARLSLSARNVITKEKVIKSESERRSFRPSAPG
jgi:hypothetical protein